MPDRQSHAREVHVKLPIGDLHVHPLMGKQIFGRSIRSRSPRRLFDRVQAGLPQMLAGGYKLALASLYVPEIEILDDFLPLRVVTQMMRLGRRYRDMLDPSPFHVAKQMLADLKTECHSYTQDGLGNVEVVTDVGRLREIRNSQDAWERKPLALVPTFEGAHVLDPDERSPVLTFRNIDTLVDLGMACLTLVHFFHNKIVQPVYPYPHEIGRLARIFKVYRADVHRDLSLGLTPLGKDVVAYLAHKGVLIDMTHCTPTARREIYDIVSRGPERGTLLMTHVGAYARNPSPYNPEDWEVRKIADTGGMVGVIFMNYWLAPADSSHSLDAIAATIKHLICKAGICAVGFGSDFDGFATPPDDLPGAPQLERLTQRLLAEGLSERHIRAVMGLNLWNTLLRGWGAVT